MELFNKYSFISCDYDVEEAEIVMFGAPYDGTSSFRPGSRFAASRIRIDSYGLETYSPYLDLDLLDRKVHDAGDLEFAFGNRETVLDMIKTFVDSIYKAGKFPLMIGGEHLITLPAVEAAVKYYDDLVILHFDAHTDLRTDYLGETKSHATVIRNIWEFLGDGRIHQFCIRSGLKEEFDWAAQGHTNLNKFNYDNLEEVVNNIKNKPVYVTIDLDVLDPSIFPGTGTPEPGGISFSDLMKIIKIMSVLNIVGVDVVELSPDYDPTGVSTAVASKVIREMLLVLNKK
ncbi:agmatinase [Serpentinicella alkaliphila]|uniref:Agmatinase n=1 Tax=Serpentinicella alkaliphila TaxID=1734049 RepID=A0A4R2TAZ5_9FIRM|nr:agmatinase [Serpentinicella alkaliphila]QUH26576.1 agmatinase [Serpentinicella alkaliphila]TCP99061.1 agmatinase [Serpentinicella alkaliphila]